MSQYRIPWSSWLLLLIAVALTTVSGLVQGHFQQRWGTPEVVADALQKLTPLPEAMGPWQRMQAIKLAENERTILQNFGYEGAIYQHRQTGQTVQCSILLGPAGPTSVHLPEICWGSRAFAQQGDRRVLDVSGRDDRFWTVMFRSTDVHNRPIRAVYAWRYDAPWSTPAEPRIQFGTKPYLYKLQLSCEGDSDASLQATQDFLQEFLPIVDKRLL